jgi:hypothetical protein
MAARNLQRSAPSAATSAIACRSATRTGSARSGPAWS